MLARSSQAADCSAPRRKEGGRCIQRRGINTMDQPGGSNMPPAQQPPPPAAPPPPPPQQGWQSTPQQPGPPPMGGGQPSSGMPSWTSNLTAQGTIAGPGGVALADAPQRLIAAVIDFVILGIIGFIVQSI